MVMSLQPSRFANVLNANMEDQSNTRKRPRQDPVSCQSCRKRKLKCDRQAPCSGCKTRHIECIYLNGTYQNITPDTTVTRPTPARSESERDVDLGGPTKPRDVTGTNIQVTQDDPKNESLQTMDWLETIVMGHWTPSAVPTPLRADLDPRTSSDQFNVIAHSQAPLRQNPIEIDIKSYLPPLAEALDLFEYYCDNLDFHFRAIIPHQVGRQIAALYGSKSRQRPIDLNHTALLFSIIASALHFKLQPDSSTSVGAYSQAAVFLAGAALIQSNYVAYPTIEGLQATMIIGQNLSSTDMPPSVSSLFVPRFAINQAVSMNLHLLDSPRFARERPSTGTSETSLELKRRIWWSLVSNDW